MEAKNDKFNYPNAGEGDLTHVVRQQSERMDRMEAKQDKDIREAWKGINQLVISVTKLTTLYEANERADKNLKDTNKNWLSSMFQFLIVVATLGTMIWTISQGKG